MMGTLPDQSTVYSHLSPCPKHAIVEFLSCRFLPVYAGSLPFTLSERSPMERKHVLSSVTDEVNILSMHFL